MTILAPNFTIEIDEARGELHFVASGRWDPAKLNEFNWELLRKSKPFTAVKRRFRVFGDLSDYAVQSAGVAEFMRQSQEASAALGVERMAIVYASELVKMQFKRVSTAMNLQMFANRAEALAWLRS